MGRLVVLEGLDGAGKHTLADRLLAGLTARGARTTTVASPRYDADVHAQLARDALHGRLGDLRDSVHGMAVLFALDRRDAAEGLRAAVAAQATAARRKSTAERRRCKMVPARVDGSLSPQNGGIWGPVRSTRSETMVNPRLR